MKVSEVTATDVADYLRLNDGEYSEDFITVTIAAAKSFMSGYTGLPMSSEEAGATTLDTYDDLVIALYVLCQDMYDNRSMYVDKANVNRVVETILGMHSVNLL